MSDAPTGKQIWAQPKPHDDAVWAICPYTKAWGGQEMECKRCPEIEKGLGQGHGDGTRGCYAVAQEACRVASFMQAPELTRLRARAEQAEQRALAAEAQAAVIVKVVEAARNCIRDDRYVDADGTQRGGVMFRGRTAEALADALAQLNGGADGK